MKHVGVASWFSQLRTAQSDFVSRERIVWIDIEGVPLHAWSRPTFSKIGSRWGEVLELEDNKDDFLRSFSFGLRSFKGVNDAEFVSDDDSVNGEEEKNDDMSKKVNLEDESDIEGVSFVSAKGFFGEENTGLDSSLPFPHGFTPPVQIQWAIEGDENSKFFHGIINRKRVNLAIKGVMVDGDCGRPCHVKEEFPSFTFANRALGSETKCVNAVVGLSGYRQVSDFCEARFGMVSRTLALLSRGCNSSFIALILKNQDPKFVNDYRPISLIGSLYKVVTKILANRLSSVIPGLISDVQTAFLPNRQILDGPFIINELLSWCKHKKQQAMVFKVDFAKAYDSIRWDFLEDVLTAFGFGPKWCSWICGCLHSSMASVLLNGSPSSEFQFYCGLKQGDPLAPYLFLLVMESLHLSWSPSNFLDQLPIFSIDFTLFSVFSINLKKSNLLGVGVRSEYVKDAAVNLGCLTMKTPFKYLGVMVGGICATSQAWEDTIGKDLWPRALHLETQNPIGSRFGILLSQFNVGNGCTLNSGKEVWIGDNPLCVLFPRIFALETNKDSSVAVKLSSVTSSLRRPVRGGSESSQLSLLQEYIEGTILFLVVRIGGY
ncbi:RNA-directed DNA polymerase, eukaryota [Tanacetum coccineum]